MRFVFAATAGCVLASALASGCSSGSESASETATEALGVLRSVTITGKTGWDKLAYTFSALEEGPVYAGSEQFVPSSGATDQLAVTVTTSDVQVTQTGVNQFTATITGTTRSYQLKGLLMVGGGWRWTVLSNDSDDVLTVVTVGFGGASSSALIVGALADDADTVPSAGVCIGDPPGGTVGFDTGNCSSQDPAQCFEDTLKAAGCSPPDKAQYQLKHQPGFEWNVVKCPIAVQPSIDALVWEYQATSPVYSSIDCVGGAAGSFHVLYDPRCTTCSKPFLPQ